MWYKRCVWILLHKTFLICTTYSWGEYISLSVKPLVKKITIKVSIHALPYCLLGTDPRVSKNMSVTVNLFTINLLNKTNSSDHDTTQSVTY